MTGVNLPIRKVKLIKKRINEIQLGGSGIARKKTKMKLNMKKSKLFIRRSEEENRDSIFSAAHEYAVPETSKVG